MGANVILAVAAGGAIGAVGRYLVAGQIQHLFGGGFPLGTLGVNVIGSLLMGALVEVMALVWSPSPEIRALLMVGVLGGFTTFSSFSLDAVLLFERHAWIAATLYIAGSVVLSLGGFVLGLRLMRLVLA